VRKNLPTVTGIILALVSVAVCAMLWNAESWFIGVNLDSPFYPLVAALAGIWGELAVRYVVMSFVIVVLSLGAGFILVGRFRRTNPLIIVTLSLLVGAALANFVDWNMKPGAYEPGLQSRITYLGPPIARFVTVYPLLSLLVPLASIAAGLVGGFLVWRRSRRLSEDVLRVSVLFPVTAIVAILLAALVIFPYPLGNL
jgi:hypothetical protein